MLFIYRSAKQQYFTWRIYIVTKQPLHLLVSWESVRYLNLLNARPSYAEHVAYLSTRFWSILRLLYSDLHRSHMSSITRYGYHAPSFEVGLHVHFFSWEMKYYLRTLENVLLFAFLFYIAIISGVTRALCQGGKIFLKGPTSQHSEKKR